MATKTWNTSKDAIWNVGGNWVEGSPPADGDDVVFGPPPAFTGYFTVTIVKGSYSLTSLKMSGNGTLAMNGSTLSAGTVTLSKGTIKNGALTVGSMFVNGLSGAAVLDGMSVNGQITVGSTGEAHYLTVRNGLSMNGGIGLSSGSLLIDGAQTIIGAAITVANNGTSEIAWATGTASQVTLTGGSIEIAGKLNANTVSLNEAVHVSSTGYLSLTGNAMTATVFGASARIAVDAGGLVLLSQNMTSDALTDFASKVTRPDAGTVRLNGTVDNTGRTLDLTSGSVLSKALSYSPVSQNEDLLNPQHIRPVGLGGVVSGGTILNTGAIVYSDFGSLYGVTLRGLFASYNPAFIGLTVRDSLTVLNTDGSAGTLDLASGGTSLVVDTINGSNAGTFTLSNMTLRAAGISANTATVLDASFTADFAVSGGIRGTVVNKGTVAVEKGVYLDLGYASTGYGAAAAGNFENDATISILAGGRLNAAAGFVNKGVVRLADNVNAQFASTSLGTISVEGANTDLTFLAKDTTASLVGLNSDDRLFLQIGGAGGTVGSATATVSGRTLTLSEDGVAVATFDLGQDGWSTGDFATSISSGIVTVSNTHGAAATTPVVTTPIITTPVVTTPVVTTPTKLDTGGVVTSNGYTLHDRPVAADQTSAAYAVDGRPNLAFVNGTTGVGGITKFDTPAAGGPDYIKWAYIMSGSDGMAFATDTPNAFIHSGSGSDAIAVKNGNNILDGGTGSNFLSGGTGNDVFYTDTRPAEITWSTLINFHAGDEATVWGFKAGVSTMKWSYYDATGKNGVSGASLDINVDGGAGRNGSGLDARVTFAGLSVAQASAMLNSTGSLGGNDNYLHFYNQGV